MKQIALLILIICLVLSLSSTPTANVSYLYGEQPHSGDNPDMVSMARTWTGRGIGF